MRAPLPHARGPLSHHLLHAWSTGATVGSADDAGAALDAIDPTTDDDLHLALWCCYQLHHGGFEGLPDDLEWDLATLAFRNELDALFEGALREEHHPAALPTDATVALRVITEWSGPPLASHLATRGDRWQLDEFAIHRSAYQLKEADGHTWGIPRLDGEAKANVVAIQHDEYGAGDVRTAHATLFAEAMAELGLDPRYGHHIDHLPGTTLATDNLLSLFGLHGRLRGALVGHLALFEMTSTAPMSAYLQAARRLGELPSLARFYEVHVHADAEHGQLALDHVVAPFVAAEPDLEADVIFGAAALSRVESRFARALLGAWGSGRTSLWRPDHGGAAASLIAAVPA